MVGESLDGDVPPVDPDDSLHDADLDPLAIEEGALLDVQLEEGAQIARRALHFGQPTRIAADRLDAPSDRLPAVTDDIERFGAEIPDQRAAADQAPLLVGEHDHLERMACRHAVLVQNLRTLDGADDADVPVVGSSVRHRVDVRSEQDRRQPGDRPFAAADDVPGRIDAHRQARLTHQPHHVIAAGDVGVAECHAADAAFRIAAEPGELEDTRLDPIPAHPHL